MALSVGNVEAGLVTQPGLQYGGIGSAAPIVTIAPTRCPAGTHYGQRACPAGMACSQELTCIPDLVGRTPGEGGASEPTLADILAGLGGGGGGSAFSDLFGEPPQSAVGLAPVDRVQSNPIALLLILLGVAGLGYYWYTHRKKGGG